MPVDISNILHVLAHELRTPTGIAQGYIRMLLENRLTDPADRQRALEQTQRALARVSELSHESTRLAAWYEDERGPTTRVDLRTLLERVAADAGGEPPVMIRSSIAAADVGIPTFDANALSCALVTIVKATARELRHQSCTLSAGASPDGIVDILIGKEEQFAAAGEGPDAPTAGGLALERGGLGLSLLLAVAVLEAHAAIPWTLNGARTTVGIRFRLEERSGP